MSPAQFRAALQTLGMSVNDFARIIGINGRNAARYCDDRGEGPSPSAEYCIKAMLAFRAQLDEAESCGEENATYALIADHALKGEFDE